MKLRSHHALCLSAFEGSGYDKKFVERMRSVVGKIMLNSPVKLVVEEDSICDNCPKTDCPSDKIKLSDQAILKIAGLGEEMPAKTVYETLSGKLTDDDIDKLCGSCFWKMNETCDISAVKLKTFARKIKPVEDKYCG